MNGEVKRHKLTGNKIKFLQFGYLYPETPGIVCVIINLRHELPLRKRLLSDTATTFLWAFWIYLWWPFFEILRRIVMIHASAEDIADTIFDEIHAVTVEHALMMLIGRASRRIEARYNNTAALPAAPATAAASAASTGRAPPARGCRSKDR